VDEEIRRLREGGRADDSPAADAVLATLRSAEQSARVHGDGAASDELHALGCSLMGDLAASPSPSPWRPALLARLRLSLGDHRALVRLWSDASTARVNPALLHLIEIAVGQCPRAGCRRAGEPDADSPAAG
jgi:hypothetical protein